VVAMVADAQLINHMDHFVWGLPQNGLFSIKSMYRVVLTVQAIPYNILIWKLKLPLKIKVLPPSEKGCKRSYRGVSEKGCNYRPA
jgi:hypothetical protein